MFVWLCIHEHKMNKTKNGGETMKKIISLLLVFVLMFGVCVPAFAASEKEQKLRLVVPKNWQMNVSDSRSVEAVFEGEVKNRVLQWSAQPQSVASVDKWGRVTALKKGTATISAQTSDGLCDSVTLNVTEKSAGGAVKKAKTDYSNAPAGENNVLQKIVKRYDKKSSEVPPEVKNEKNYEGAKTAFTADGAKWEITNYGVLRTDENASNERDKEQRFMGDRYFYSQDTRDGKVLAIFADGENGIWTVMQDGYTHILLVQMSATQKAALMSENTQKYVARRGMVCDSKIQNDGTWKAEESDNDGLWTSMYGAGELMRYAVLKNDPTATKEEIEAARKTAYLSTEAVLLLTYISMRKGTTQSLVHAQRNGSVADVNIGKWYAPEVLLKGGDYSANVPSGSPAAEFEKMNSLYMGIGKRSYVMSADNLALYSPQSFANPFENPDKDYETRTRLLEGFWARTYSFKDEIPSYDGYIYWSMNSDKTATGVSTRSTDNPGYLLNGEQLRGVKVDASGSVPQRLWNDLIGSGYDVSDIVYKGDTSADEIIGHLFLYKLAYDILGAEDEEIAQLIRTTMEKFAQHLVDNGYALCDGTGQPTTWGKFSRTYLHNGQVMGGAPLQSIVLLCAFKLAAYVTGEQKWEDEYMMAALDPAYEYAKLATQEWERYSLSILEYVAGVSKPLAWLLRPLAKTELFKVIYRLILNYSDEEMAMLAYYLLFQMESDEELLGYYREGLNDWWYSMSFSENPLWYYIYQLAYPNEEKTDAYGNSLVETAAWSLSRHPVETVCYLASNDNRDDIARISLSKLGIGGTEDLTFDPTVRKPLFFNSSNKTLKLVGTVLSAAKLEWKVAAPDERQLHKYNGSSYALGDESNCEWMEGSTTYTLPYWMGRYHGMLK